MASPPPKEDDFTHTLAIKLSRALNIVNPNDLLARRVIDIAKTNTVDGFATGKHRTLFDDLAVLDVFQRPNHLASSRIHFCSNSTPKSSRTSSRKNPALSHSQCRELWCTTVRF